MTAIILWAALSALVRSGALIHASFLVIHTVGRRAVSLFPETQSSPAHGDVSQEPA